VVHATPERFDRLETLSANLTEVGRAEQARWAAVAEFDAIPDALRADREWLDTLRAGTDHEAIIELQPLLTRSEGSLVLSSIAERFRRAQQEAIIGSGVDFSGRAWVRARLTLRTITEIIRRYFSVQSVHGPLLSPLVEVKRRKEAVAGGTAAAPVQSASQLVPVVAVVDGGVPTNHRQLESFRRGTVIDPDSAGVLGTHGTFVASRVVFGDPRDPLNTPAVATCHFLDVVVARDAGSADDKIVSRAVNFAAVNYPDVRTFNLSLGDYTPYAAHPPVERSERLLLTQDLDNVIFARDILVVVAAGNSLPNTLPSTAYPEHWQDARWALGNWALGFNALTCGSFVRDWTLLGGVATIPFAPSPFCRVGPGLAASPMPDFAAHGGNGNAAYGWSPGLGVFGLSLDGLWEDKNGTSFAAPLLARECAFAFQALQGVCPPGARPYGVAVKALLALTSSPINLPAPFNELARRTLGYGEADSNAVRSARPDAAVFVWQGVINDKSDLARVVVPIPVDWLKSADDPVCDAAVSWDTPVNAVFPNVYGCRRVDMKLRAVEGGTAARPLPGVHNAYPLRVRTHPLKKVFEKEAPDDDLWMFELSYEEVCDYPATQTFIPEQRVAVALRLRDRGNKVSPQEFVQNHSLAVTMTRLSAAIISAQVPVTIKPRQ
jgi:hypothetical protein